MKGTPHGDQAGTGGATPAGAGNGPASPVGAGNTDVGVTAGLPAKAAAGLAEASYDRNGLPDLTDEEADTKVALAPAPANSTADSTTTYAGKTAPPLKKSRSMSPTRTTGTVA